VPALTPLQVVEVPQGGAGQEMRQLSPASRVEPAGVSKEVQRGGFDCLEDKVLVGQRPLGLEAGAESIVLQGQSGDGFPRPLDAGAEPGMEAFRREGAAAGLGALFAAGPIAVAQRTEPD